MTWNLVGISIISSKHVTQATLVITIFAILNQCVRKSYVYLHKIWYMFATLWFSNASKVLDTKFKCCKPGCGYGQNCHYLALVSQSCLCNLHSHLKISGQSSISFRFICNPDIMLRMNVIWIIKIVFYYGYFLVFFVQL